MDRRINARSPVSLE
uniref:Uncharacterized protein n=1 Tax=Arundo donax TaxID=35708 RepID=A0A0A9E2V5_ARUDO